MIWKYPQQTLSQWGETQSALQLNEAHSILIWNVFKGQRGDNFARDLRSLSEEKSFLLLQETMLFQQTPPEWKVQLGELCWNVAQSFEYSLNKSSTGVAIGSKQNASQVDFLRPRSRELFWLTPKISLFAEYDFQGTKALIVSSHVLNFVTTGVFIQSLEEIAQKVSQFSGPVLLAGDFNTWNLKRFLAMKAIFRDLQLHHVEFPLDRRFLKLDHLFVRGFDVLDTKILHSVVTSDHFPLEAKIILKK